MTMFWNLEKKKKRDGSLSILGFSPLPRWRGRCWYSLGSVFELFFFFFSWLGRFERADIGVIPPWFCLARGVCLEILLSDFHFQGWRVRRDRRRGLLGQTEHWLESKWVRGGWGERGACSKKRFRLSGGRPWLMRNCTLSALEEPGWK